MKRLAPITALALVACWLLAAHASASVYWSNYSTSNIGRADSSGLNPDQALVSVTGHPWGVAVDADHLYWTSRDDLIGRADLDGGNPNQSFVSGVTGPLGIAVNDQYAFWANADSSSIGLSNLALGGPNPDFLAAGGPVGVALDGHHMYWTNSYTNSIGHADLDGSNADPEFITGASVPSGIAVDAQHVYWANYDVGTIGRADLDGSHVDQSFITAADKPQGLAVDGQHIWWSNVGSNTIGRARLNGSDASQYAIPNASSPIGVAATPLATGTAQPSADTLYFTAPGTHTFAVKNDGEGDLELDHARLAGAGDFKLTGDGCSMATVAPGDSCTVDVQFVPAITGNRTATLTFPDNEATPITAGLTGTTQPPQTDPPAADATQHSALGTRHSALECGRTTCFLRLASPVSTEVQWRLVRRGRVVRRGTATTTSGGTARFKLGHLRSGRYLLHVDGVEQVPTINVRRNHR